jgi:conflict system pore-forming effector with SLATT domain
VLAQRIEDITRRVMRTEVNAAGLKPYDKDKGLPPRMDAAQGGDDGLSSLTSDGYVELRLGDQLNFYKTKTVKLERQLKVIQWSIFIIGGLGSLLAAINQQLWIALTTAVAAALTTYLTYQQTESTVTKYNQTATDLANVKSWWTALPPEEQAKQSNVDTLVDHTEQVLQSELDGWVQQMQNALAELRKGQAQAAEKEEPQSGDGGAPPAPATAPVPEPPAGDQDLGEVGTATEESGAPETTGAEQAGEGEAGAPTTGEEAASEEGTGETAPDEEGGTEEETTDGKTPPES